MSIIERIVKKQGNIAHVTIPKTLIGSKVWIVTDKDMGDLQELIQMTLLYRKAYKYDQSTFIKDFDGWKAGVENRLKRIESILVTWFLEWLPGFVFGLSNSVVCANSL